MKTVMIELALLATAAVLPACLIDQGDDYDPPPTHPNPPYTPPPAPPEPGACGETACSPRTPDGLEFHGVTIVHDGWPTTANHHIATHGTHEVSLQFGNTETDFSLAYNATAIDPSILSAQIDYGAHLTLQALASGTTELRIFDPATDLAYDRYAYAASEFARAVPVGIDEWVLGANFTADPNQSYVFYPGKRTIGIAYMNDLTPTNRLVDTSATLATPGATQDDWNRITFANASLGHHAIAASIGGSETSIDIEVVDTADTIVPLIAQDGLACFGAFTAGGAFIAGIPWTYEIGGAPVTGQTFFGPNCVFGTGPFTVTAHAGGKSLTVTTTHS